MVKYKQPSPTFQTVWNVINNCVLLIAEVRIKYIIIHQNENTKQLKKMAKKTSMYELANQREIMAKKLTILCERETPLILHLV